MVWTASSVARLILGELVPGPVPAIQRNCPSCLVILLLSFPQTARVVLTVCRDRESMNSSQQPTGQLLQGLEKTAVRPWWESEDAPQTKEMMAPPMSTHGLSSIMPTEHWAETDLTVCHILPVCFRSIPFRVWFILALTIIQCGVQFGSTSSCQIFLMMCNKQNIWNIKTRTVFLVSSWARWVAFWAGATKVNVRLLRKSWNTMASQFPRLVRGNSLMSTPKKW